jgi:hypothetical protein
MNTIFFQVIFLHFFIDETQVKLVLFLCSFNFESRLSCFGCSFVLNIFSLKYCNYKNHDENLIEIKTHLSRNKKFDDTNENDKEI